MSGVTVVLPVPVRFSTGATVSGVELHAASAAAAETARMSFQIVFIQFPFGYETERINRIERRIA